MPKFKRQVTTSFAAFQFKMIELSRQKAASSPQTQADYHSEKQWAAFKAAEMPVNLRDIGLARFSEDTPPTLMINVSVPGLAGSINHFLKEGDWLFVDPRSEKMTGEVLTDEQFRELGAVQV